MATEVASRLYGVAIATLGPPIDPSLLLVYDYSSRRLLKSEIIYIIYLYYLYCASYLYYF